MSEPSTLLPVSLSASGYEDGLGRRSLEIDRESGVMLERLHLRPEIGAFETFLRERVAFSAVVDDDRFSRIRGIERDSRGSLTVVSQFVAGNRLCDLLEAATGLPAHEASSPSVDAALGFLLEILPALGTLHDNGGFAHGTLGPGRVVLTPASHVVMLDWVYGPIVQRLQFNRRALWLEFGVAAPPADDRPARLDTVADLAQASLTAIMIVLGRPLRRNEYQDLTTLLGEVSEIAQIRGSTQFAASLEAFLRRTLPLAAQQPYATAAEAVADVRQVAREIGATKCRAALTAFVEDMNRLIEAEREYEYEAPPPPSIEHEDSPIDELTAEFDRVREISLDDLSLLTAEPVIEEPIADLMSLPSLTDIEPPPAADTIVTDEDAYVPPPVLAPIEPEPIVARPAILAPAPVIEPVAVVEPPAPVAVDPPAPAPTKAIAIVDPEGFPEPAVTPDRVLEPDSGFQFLDQGDPVATDAVDAQPAQAAEPDPVSPTVNAAPPAPAPAAQAQSKAQSKRKRRGSKGQRDKLRSNAVPAQPPKPVAPPMPPPAAPIPMPTFNRLPDAPRQDAAPPAPLALRPPTPVKAPAPLRLKSDGASGFNPPATRAERREPAPAPPIPRFLEREDPPTTAFPWRLAAVAAVVIVAVIGVGRAYIPGHNTPASETAEPAPVLTPPAPKKAEATKPGNLAVTTQPAGAHVMLDGKDVGESPITVDNVAPGKHTLTFITPSGTIKKPIRMEAGKPLSLDVPIYSGWIAVFSPVTLDIAENGKAIGTTEQGRLMLSPGRHQLTFSNKEMGYKTTQAVDIQPGEESSVSLVPTGELAANATPWAEVWLEGKKIGDTPLSAIRVPLGTHEVVFKNPKFPERRVTVTVTASTPVTASVDFNK